MKPALRRSLNASTPQRLNASTPRRLDASTQIGEENHMFQVVGSNHMGGKEFNFMLKHYINPDAVGDVRDPASMDCAVGITGSQPSFMFSTGDITFRTQVGGSAP